MEISAINRMTLLDFPKRVAAIVFTAGCNMRCGFCHNDEFVLPEKLKELKKDFIPEEYFFNFLEERRGKLDGVVICGGEPTIHKDLKTFARKIKEMGFLVKLDTNGTRPEVIQELLNEKILDYIAMDVKHLPARYNELVWVNLDEKKIEKSINIIMNSHVEYEFRTTVIDGFHTIEDIELLARRLKGAKNYYFQNFRCQKTLLPNFSGKPLSRENLILFKEVAEQYIDRVGIRL